jgi:hypothetical protein
MVDIKRGMGFAQAVENAGKAIKRLDRKATAGGDDAKPPEPLEPIPEVF